MAELAVWYPFVKSAHVGLVLASGLLFAVRGALVLAGRPGAMNRRWRLLSYGIDTLLLAAGLTLWRLLALNPFSSPWLGVKLLLLMLYVVLGTLALKRARTPLARQASYIAALGVYGFIAAVAVAHHPAGLWWRWWPHAG